MTRIVSSFEGFSEPLDVNLLLNKLYRHGDRLLIFFHKGFELSLMFRLQYIQISYWHQLELRSDHIISDCFLSLLFVHMIQFQIPFQSNKQFLLQRETSCLID